MRTFQSITATPLGTGALLLGLGLFFLQVFVCVAAFRNKRGVWFRVFCAAQPLVGLAWVSLLFDGSFLVTYLPTPRGYPAAVAFVYARPWAAVPAVTRGLFVPAAAGLYAIRAYRRHNLLPDAIKDAVDFLPVGVSFSREDGVVVLANLQMQSWARQLTGRGAGSGDLLWQTVCEKGTVQENGAVLCPCGERTLLFTREAVAIDQKEFTQLCGYDMTEQYRVTRELEALNARLLDVQKRMRQYSAQISDLVQKKETLNAQILVHDELGQTLLAQKYYFDHPEKTDEAQLLRALKYTNLFFLRDAEQPQADDPVETAVSRAATIGVQVQFSGEWPKNAETRVLLARAVGECAANTAKHTSGSVLAVEAHGRTVTLTSVGASAAREPFAERGGLKSLRQLVESAGGQMRVIPSPEFCVIITLPNE